MRTVKSAFSSLVLVSALSGLAFFSGMASAKWASSWRGQQEQNQAWQVEGNWTDRAVAELNSRYVGLNLSVSSEASEEVIRDELRALDAALRGEIELHPGSLMHLACSKVDCGGKNY